MTGRHEFRNGVTHTIFERERLRPDAVTLAQILKRGGYTTGIFGKWHLGDEPDRWPDKRGFDEMFIHGAGGIGQTYSGSCGDAPGNTYFDPAVLHNGRFVKTKGYCTDVFFDQALKWFDQTHRRGPFFAYITPNAPHAPLQVRPEDEARYAGKVPANVAKFFGMVANIDDNIGRLLERLRSLNLERSTLVIFMNDNGGTTAVNLFNAGMRGAKVTPWMGGIRAASFWRWPGVLRPATVDRLAAHLDILPTLAEICGVRLTPAERKQIEGRSLLPLLRNPSAEWSDRLLFTHVGRWESGRAATAKYRSCSIRTQRFQMVSVDPNGRKQWQLFDLEKDPGEQRDIAGRSPALVAEFDRAYDRWWDSIQPDLVNEAAVGPPVNPFKALFWQQFGGGPR
jgi:arylsulfatase